MARRLIGAALVLVLAVQPAMSRVTSCSSDAITLSERDTARLEALEGTRLEALSAALLSESPDDRATLSELYANGLVKAETIPAGDYRCRTIKLGGLTNLTVYGFFSCTITEDGEALVIEKLTGSQRLFGTLTPGGDGMVYRGALHYADEAPIAYEGTSDRDQVGCLYKVSANGDSHVLELPEPAFESVMDVLVLVPAS